MLCSISARLSIHHCLFGRVVAGNPLSDFAYTTGGIFSAKSRHAAQRAGATLNIMTLSRNASVTSGFLMPAFDDSSSYVAWLLLRPSECHCYTIERWSIWQHSGVGSFTDLRFLAGGNGSFSNSQQSCLAYSFSLCVLPFPKFRPIDRILISQLDHPINH